MLKMFWEKLYRKLKMERLTRSNFRPNQDFADDAKICYAIDSNENVYMLQEDIIRLENWVDIWKRFITQTKAITCI